MILKTFCIENFRGISKLNLELDRTTVELADVRELSNDRHQPRTRLLGFVDHPPLPFAHRRILILLQHSQVAADDAGRRAELMHGEREKWWIRIL